MRITVLNGTNRMKNQCGKVTQKTFDICKAKGHDVSLVDLKDFTIINNEEYILFTESSNRTHKKHFRDIINSEILLIIIPKYFLMLPRALKNFIELTKVFNLFEYKIIGLIESATDADSSLQPTDQLTKLAGIMEINSIVLNKKVIINHERIEENKIKEFVKYSVIFFETFQNRTASHY